MFHSTVNPPLNKSWSKLQTAKLQGFAVILLHKEASLLYVQESGWYVVTISFFKFISNHTDVKDVILLLRAVNQLSIS